MRGARRMMQQFRWFLAPVADIFMGETLGSVSEVTTYLDVFADRAADLWVSVTLEDRDPVAGAPRLRSGEPFGASVVDRGDAVRRPAVQLQPAGSDG